MLIRTLMHNKNESVRKSIERTFKVICSESMIDVREDGVTESPRVYVLRMLLRNLPEVDVKSDHCEEYFNLTTFLMKLCQTHFKNQQQEHDKLFLEDGSFSSHALLDWCIRSLRQRPTYEDRYSQTTDKVLAGYL